MSEARTSAVESPSTAAETTLDPQDWEELRALGHRMVDDVIAFHSGLADRPAWQPLPDATKATFQRPAPRKPEGADVAYDEFLQHVLPYPFGNVHPRAWGWVNGTGSTLGAFAEMLGAAMNSNCWGGEHAASYVEAQVIDWMKQWVGFDAASGVLVSGGSVANVIGLAAARDARADAPVGQVGVHALARPLVVYASEQVHNSVDKAVSLLGIGLDNLRRVPTDAEYRIDVDALERAIAEDRAAGKRPLCVIGTAGTVNTGATDDLDALADICAREQMWLHVDGAFGALAALSPAHRPMLRGMERADSLAFDLHKWLYVPIEAGCILVRDAEAHRRPFSPPATYLASLERGVASGPHLYSMLGPQLTRGFRALKVWMLIKAHGTDVYGRLVEQNIAQAGYLAESVRASDELELAAPVPLNVVCFRYAPPHATSVARGPRVAPGAEDHQLDALNRELLMRLQERGIALPSSTVLQGRFVLRVAITNHRTRRADLDALVDATRRLGREILAARARDLAVKG